MNTYEFRKWNVYEEWYEVEAKDEKEAREKLVEMIHEFSTFGQDHFVGLYAYTVLERLDEASTEKF